MHPTHGHPNPAHPEAAPFEPEHTSSRRVLPPLPVPTMPEPQLHQDREEETTPIPIRVSVPSVPSIIRIPSPVHARGSEASHSSLDARPSNPPFSSTTPGNVMFQPEPAAGPSRQVLTATRDPSPPEHALHAGSRPLSPTLLEHVREPHPRVRPMSDLGREFARNIPHAVRTVSYDARSGLPQDRRDALNIGNSEMLTDGLRSQRSGLDWIIPHGNGNGGMNGDGYGHMHAEEKQESSAGSAREKSVEERLKPTLGHANVELERYETKGRRTGFALNACIGLQVVLGALTTGVAAATTGRSTSIATSVLGALSTLAASYLARARGSGEPEVSTARRKDLEHFIRECEAFVLDYGHVIGTGLDWQIERFRKRFEEIMGNAVNGLGRQMQDKMRAQV